MTKPGSIDRATIRAMVEDFWRAFLAIGSKNRKLGEETILRFDERIKATADLMSNEQANLFLKMVDEEREIIFDEYKNNSASLKFRLGILPEQSQQMVTSSYDRRQPLGELVVRTAIRATVWESIRSLFRQIR